MVIDYKLDQAAVGSSPSAVWEAARERRRECEKRYREKHREEINLRARIKAATQPQKIKDAQKRYRIKHNEKENQRKRAYQYKSKYALTVELRDELFRQNNGMCFICNKQPSEHVDHDHSTGVIRGVLCRGCNFGLGNFRDNPQFLIAAVKYLQRT